MSRFVFGDAATGEITRTQDRDEAAGPGEVVAAHATATPATHWFDGATLRAYSSAQGAAKAARPSQVAVWSNATMAWSDPRSLADLKATKNAEINAWRNAADQGTFLYAGKAIQADDASKARIFGVGIVVSGTGAMPPAWPGVWKAADNSYVSIPGVTAWNTFYAAMVAAGTANFVRSETLKAQLAAATTAAQVSALTWE